MRGITFVFALLVSISLMLGACAAPVSAPAASDEVAAEPTAEPQAELPVVRVGHVPVTIYAPLFVAVEKGYFNKDWSTANPDLAKGFVKAYIRGARDLNGELWLDEDNLATIEKYTNVPADVVARANRSYHDPNGRVPLDDLMELQRFFRSEGQLNYDEDIDLSTLINLSYAEQAVEELGGEVEWK